MTNILIVDDSDVDRLLMEGLLGQAADFTVIAAENGAQALKKLDEWSIDLVLTDLQMPKLDGLELVKIMRQRKLEIPVVLTTGQGSEDIAAEALRAGAAGYIPKTKLNQLLISTVREVLEIFNGEPSYSRLLDCAQVSHFEFNLRNDPSLIPQLVDFCEQMLRSMSQLDRIDSLRVAIAVDQALQNAFYRGNLELDSEYVVPSYSQGSESFVSEEIQERLNSKPYCDRSVHVVMEIKPAGFVILVRDEGPGFDTSRVGNWDQPSARGTHLMKAFMDRVKYSRQGNEVELAFRFEKSIQRPGMGAARPSTSFPTGRLVCADSGNCHVIDEPKFVIGSRSACHLRLSNSSVAPLHCMIVQEGDHLMLLNLTPGYETLVNEKPGNGRQLKSGDKIQIGELTFAFESDARANSK